MGKILSFKKLKFYVFSKNYIWLSLSVIITGYLNIPVLSQTKDNKTQISINPQVIQDRVTLRVKVTKNNKLQSNLKAQDFSLYVDCKSEDVKNCEPTTLDDWRNPKESTPLPTKIVVLLDLSGSMKELDKGGEPKLQGAIDAIQKFTQVLAARGGDTQIVIVPFSDKSKYTNCEDDPVTNEAINRFAPANSQQHKQDIDKLQRELKQELFYTRAKKNNQKSTRPENTKSRICGETNLYQSLANTINFLGNINQTNNSQDPSYTQNQAKLHIVLLSDGFNTVPFADSSDICDTSHFEKLNTEYLQRYISKITIHTVGYGRTPRELGSDPDYSQVLQGKPAECTDIQKFTNEKIREQFKSELVDQQHLQQIAELTKGINEFSGNSQEIAQRFREILDTIIGEYQITYTQKDADTADQHDVRVVIQSIGSEKASYSMPFVFQVPFRVRLWTIFIFIIVPLGLSILLVYLLGEEIKKQAQ
ncbi:MAG: vWA domain-containing protein [Nostoc sp. EkiNYC01]|nr:vWA domain-containing protein [Nostoc sp. EkiNYC01]